MIVTGLEQQLLAHSPIWIVLTIVAWTIYRQWLPIQHRWHCWLAGKMSLPANKRRLHRDHAEWLNTQLPTKKTRPTEPP